MLRPDISRLNVNQMFTHFPHEPFKKLQFGIVFHYQGEPKFIPSAGTERDGMPQGKREGRRNDRYLSNRKY